MEYSIYLPLSLILVFLVLFAFVYLINILKKIREQLATIGKHVEFTTNGTFNATFKATINKNNMEKKIEEINIESSEKPALSAASLDKRASDSESVDGSVSGSFESKTSPGGSKPGDGGGA